MKRTILNLVENGPNPAAGRAALLEIVREHPEYIAMRDNLTSLQRESTERLEDMRKLRALLAGSPTPLAAVLAPQEAMRRRAELLEAGEKPPEPEEFGRGREGKQGRERALGALAEAFGRVEMERLAAQAKASK